MISVRIRISTRSVHVRHSHEHIHFLSVAEAFTSPSGSVNALANDYMVNFSRRRKFHMTESTSGLFKQTRNKYFGKLVNTMTTTGHTKMFILILSQFGPWSFWS